MFSLSCVEFHRYYFLVLTCVNLYFHSSERLALLAGGSLEISEVTMDDAGTYSCVADSGNETIEAHAELTVQGM